MERIALANTEFEGNNAVYLFDEAVTALVDTGIATAATREALEDGLAEHGVAFADIDLVCLTHWHADHSGLAGAIQAESGATVHASAIDAPLAAGEASAWDEYESLQRTAFERWGMPEEPRAELLAFFEGGSETMGDPVDIDPIEIGASLDLGQTTLRVVDLSGHTAGQIGFALDRPEGHHLLSADALLPRYTPNVGGADLRAEDPLGTYLETLDRVVAADYDRAYPGHRDPIDDPTGRAREIVGHHRDRAERILDLLGEIEPADPWTISAHLFGDLAGIHIMHGPGEAYAHLTHLEASDLVAETADGWVLGGTDRESVDEIIATP